MMLKDCMEMYDSLLEAVDQAGGTGASFRPGNLHQMTVLELMEHLAPNKVRFVCTKRKHKPTRTRCIEEEEEDE